MREVALRLCGERGCRAAACDKCGIHLPQDEGDFHVDSRCVRSCLSVCSRASSLCWMHPPGIPGCSVGWRKHYRWRKLLPWFHCWGGWRCCRITWHDRLVAEQSETIPPPTGLGWLCPALFYHVSGILQETCALRDRELIELPSLNAWATRRLWAILRRYHWECTCCARKAWTDADDPFESVLADAFFVAIFESSRHCTAHIVRLSRHLLIP